MEKQKRIIASVLALCLLAASLPQLAAKAEAKKMPAKGSVSLHVGESATLTLKKCKKKIRWKTSNKKVAAIKGKKKSVRITAKAVGTAKVTARVGKKKYTCKVVVKAKDSQNDGTESGSQEDNNQKNDDKKNDNQGGNNSGSKEENANNGGNSQMGNGNTNNNNGNNNNGNSNNNNNGSTSENGSSDPAQDYDASTVSSTDFSKYFSLHAIHKSTATYYDNGYTNTCCNLDDIAAKYDVAAINEYDYNNGVMAGAYLEVTGPKGKVNVLVTDLMPFQGNESNCAVGALDLNENTFAKIADKIDGKVNISWKVIAFPTTEPIQYKFKDTSSQWWCEVQVRNQRYPVAKCEVKNSDGTYTELPRKEYNYFAAESGLGAGPYTFRVTDIYGQVIEDTGIALTPGGIVNGGSNFPIIP